MIGIENLLPPYLGRLARERFIAGNHGRLAEARDRARGRERTIAVDHEPRIALRDQSRVELVRELLRDTRDADIPGDMPRQLVRRQPEIAERFWDQPPVMVAGKRKVERPVAFCSNSGGTSS